MTIKKKYTQDPNVNNKICNICNIDKPIKYFHKTYSNRDGYNNSCRPCFATRRNANYQLNKLKIKPVLDRKTCPECHIEKDPGHYFNKKVGAKDGYDWRCKECERQAAARRRAEYPEWDMFHGAKKRAKKDKLPFSILKENISAIWPKDNRCVYCLSIMTRAVGHPSAGTHSPSLDKIIPYLGYVPNNIRIICYSCNTAKGDKFDPEIFIRIGEQMRKDIERLKGE